MRRFGARAAAAALLVVIGLAGTEARAAPSRREREQARRMFRQGEEELAAGRYDAAIADYQAAYDLVPLPGLLFNLGQAYRLKGDRPRAVDAYERYLAADPDGSAAPVARRHLERLRALLEVEARPPPPPPPEPPAATPPPPPPPSPELEPARDIASPPPRRGGSALRTAGLVTGGAGLLAAGAAVVLELHARSLARDVEDTYDAGRVADGERAERTGIILGVAGAASLVTGGVLYYLGERAGTPALTIGPTADPPGLFAAGTF